MKTRDGHEITVGMRLYGYYGSRSVTVIELRPNVSIHGDMIVVSAGRSRKREPLTSLEYPSAYVADPANTQMEGYRKG